MTFFSHNTTLSPAAAALSMLLFTGFDASSAQTAGPEAQAFFRDQVYPILKANCIKCHGGEKTKGGLELTALRQASARGDGDPPKMALYGSAIRPGSRKSRRKNRENYGSAFRGKISSRSAKLVGISARETNPSALGKKR